MVKLSLTAFASILLLGFAPYLKGQTDGTIFPNQGKPTYSFEHPLTLKADSLLKTKQFQEAIRLFEKAEKAFEQQKNYEGQAYALMKRAECYYKISSSSQTALDLGLEALRLYKQRLESNHLIKSKVQYMITKIQHRQNNPTQSVSYIDSAYATYTKGEYYDSLLYYNLVRYKFYSNYYNQTPNSIDTAIKYLDIRKLIFQKADIENTKNWLYLLNDYSAFYVTLGDYEKAEAYGFQELSLFQQDPGRYDSSYYFRSQFRIASAHYKTGKYKLSLRRAIHLLHLAKPIDHFNYVNLIAINYNETDRYDSALYYNKIAEKIWGDIIRVNPKKENKNINKAALKLNKGLIYLKLNKYDTAAIFLKQALRNDQTYSPNLIEAIANKYSKLASIYARMEKYQKAYHYSDSTIQILTQYLPLTPSLINSSEPLTYLGRRVERAVLAYSQNNDLVLLQSALDDMDIYFQSLLSIRKNFQGNEKKLSLGKESKVYFGSGVEASFLLNKLSPHDSLISQALNNMGRGKSLLLLDQLGEYSLITNDKVPSGLRDQFAEAKVKIDELDKQIDALFAKSVMNDSIRILNLQRMDWMRFPARRSAATR